MRQAMDKPEIGTKEHHQWLWESLDDYRVSCIKRKIRYEPSDDAATWNELTHPEFEPLLRERLAGNLNPFARDVTEKALETCLKNVSEVRQQNRQ